MPTLRQLRLQIDRLDDRIVELFNRRLRLAEKIATLKIRKGSGVYHPRREQQVLARLSRRKSNLLTAAELQSVYRHILRASRAHQKRMFRRSGK